MSKKSLIIAAAFSLTAAISSVATPAFALGGCGPNGHLNGWNQCVFGGQNQNYCLITRGHYATRMLDGTMRCL